MHARHRSPGNGYRSTTPNTSRISPDDYHRSFNRPLLRPNSNSFQPPQPPPRKPDIFVDAGRLAAEYLVSQGILPPNVLSLPSKWSNGSFKRISRLPEPESFNLGQEGRTSALARLGNAVTDSVAVGSSRRRFVGDEFGFRNGSRGRRRPPYRGGYGSDWVEEQETNSATCSDIQRAQSAENVGESSHIQHIKCERSVSMPNRAFVYDDNEEKERVDKRGFEEDDVKEGVKRPRETKKQLFPSSFKICDLNLMQVSETHENHDCDAATVNIKRPQSDHHKEIEVIDLENDSAQEDKDLVMEDRKTETVYTDLDEIHNHAQNTGGIPDTQDGYGLMISELLGNDFPNCSAVPEHINPMHNDIGLPNEEGAIGDDDSIYMSLGEIPLSMLDL
uniref:Uncharacterized protein n=1 Tax=Cannabis sativa TaxID=3483 RepID=A0A803Q7A5_CANSA